MQNGSELLIQKIKSRARNSLLFGIGAIALGLVGGYLFLPLTPEGKLLDTGSQQDISVIILFVVSLLVILYGIIKIIRSASVMADPKRDKTVKNNPDVFSMADELYRGITYKDSQMTMSERVIANTGDLTEIAYTDEVFIAYVFTHRTNGVPDRKYLWLETARGDIKLDVFKLKDEQINALMQKVLTSCKYAKAGYSNEAKAYVKQMREKWKEGR